MAGQQGLQVMSPADAGSALAPSQPAGSSMDISPLARGNPPQTLTPLKEENDLLRNTSSWAGATITSNESTCSWRTPTTKGRLSKSRFGIPAWGSWSSERWSCTTRSLSPQADARGALMQTKEQLVFEENRLKETRMEAHRTNTYTYSKAFFKYSLLYDSSKLPQRFQKCKYQSD